MVNPTYRANLEKTRHLFRGVDPEKAQDPSYDPLGDQADFEQEMETSDEDPDEVMMRREMEYAVRISPFLLN